MAKKTSVADPILEDSAFTPDPSSASSPVDNLPAAAGKRRRGRPKKVRESEAVAEATGQAVGSDSAGSPDIGRVVKDAIAESLKKNKPAGPETRKGIVGLVKQVTRSQVAKAVRASLQQRDATAGIAAEVQETVTKNDSQDALATQHGQDHPFWHLLRTR